MNKWQYGPGYILGIDGSGMNLRTQPGVRIATWVVGAIYAPVNAGLCNALPWRAAKIAANASGMAAVAEYMPLIFAINAGKPLFQLLAKCLAYFAVYIMHTQVTAMPAIAVNCTFLGERFAVGGFFSHD